MNNREAVYTEEYKGHTIKVYQDTDYQESPKDWGDDSVFLVGYHRDFTVENQLVSEDICRAIAENDTKKTGDDDDYIREQARDIVKKYHTFGLEAYIHSGVTLALSNEGNFCDRNWDVSQLGMVFIAKSEARTKLKARKLALSLIESWNDCLSGNVYGYRAGEDAEIGSCWGFIGDYEESGILEQARSDVDVFVESERQKKQRKTKAYLLNRVPIYRRI